MKKTFKIPAGCKEITIEQIGNTIVASFEEKNRYPVDGVIYFLPKLGTTRESISIFKNGKRIVNWLTKGDNIFTDGYEMGIDYFNEYRLATDSEKQLLFDALARAGKQWNADKLCIESLKWKPKRGDSYYSFGWGDKNRFDDDNIDRWRLEHNLVFKTAKERDAALLKFNSINK